MVVNQCLNDNNKIIIKLQCYYYYYYYYISKVQRLERENDLKIKVPQQQKKAT